MASITFTNDAGETQVFDLGVLSAPTTPETPTEVKVEESDGSEQVFIPESA